jgi:hypothetical protein
MHSGLQSHDKMISSTAHHPLFVLRRAPAAGQWRRAVLGRQRLDHRDRRLQNVCARRIAGIPKPDIRKLSSVRGPACLGAVRSLSGLEVRTDATTSRIAWLAAVVSVRSRRSEAMRGVSHHAVSTVGRQGREVLLRRQLLSVMSTSSCDHDERLTGKVIQRCGLLYRHRPLAELVDEAFDIAGGCAAGARLVARPWWRVS